MSRRPLPMSSCPPRPSPKKKARSPTPIGACSACEKRSSRAANLGPIIRSSAIWLSGLKQRLGRPTTARWDYAGPEEIFREMASVATMLKGITYDRLEKIGLQYPVPDETHPGTPFLFAETFPAGRGKFIPIEHIPTVEETDDEYPFILTTGRLLEHWHGGSMTRNSQLDTLFPHPLIDLHEVDAAQLALKTGDAVRVSSRRGSIVLRANVSAKTSPGVVFIPMHFVEAAANLLTIDALDPQAKIPEFKACAVNIQVAREEELFQREELLLRGRK